MTEELHVRRSYQIEGQKRWGYWSAVLVTDGGEAIIATTKPMRVPPRDLPHEKWLLAPTKGLPTVARFEYERRLDVHGRELVERFQAEGWEPGERDAQGMVVRMTRQA